jgi:hypothetical protein
MPRGWSAGPRLGREGGSNYTLVRNRKLTGGKHCTRIGLPRIAAPASINAGPKDALERN